MRKIAAIAGVPVIMGGLAGGLTAAFAGGATDPEASGSKATMSLEEALAIAQGSVCVLDGSVSGEGYYNESTGTWWFDLQSDKPGCNPACVVNVETGEAEVNWRCTGLLPENGDGNNTAPSSEGSMTVEEAIAIAQTSECVVDGWFTGDAFYNESTDTWWLDLDIEKEGCAPACVVNAETGEVEINWRCTGALPPSGGELQLGASAVGSGLQSQQ